VLFFICGSALRGQPDHANLGGARSAGVANTAPKYRMASVRDVHPAVYEVPSGGVSLPGELYDLTVEQYAGLIAGEPANLYEAPIELADGSAARAMLYPRELVEANGFEDVSQFGGWAAFKARVISRRRARRAAN
jgi:gamma-glutamylaminecyclotransferase